MRSNGRTEPKKLERVVDRLRFALRDRLEKHIAVWDGSHVYEFVCSTRAEVWRAKTLLIKEQGTCDWLRDELKDGDVFYDVGANIGLYTVFAGKLLNGGGKIFAFEPHAENFSRLCRNIRLNGLNDIAFPLSAALTDQSGCFKFSYALWEAASSASQLSNDLDGRKAAFTELKLATTVDELVADGGLPPPNLVKIDVDGLEMQILRGMRQILEGASKPRSIQVEIQRGAGDDIKAFMKSTGFALAKTHLSMGGERKLARHKTMDEISYNAIFSPATHV